ncbi:MAG: hypothetical protein ACOC1G_04185 [Phycisphaeraceae bacterium]
MSFFLMAGCATSVEPAAIRAAHAVPAKQREAVAVWLINSPLDPLGVTGLSDLARAIRKAGFDVVLLPRASGGGLAERVREAHANGRTCALIAWSGASLWVHDALSKLERDGGWVELVVYLDSNWIKDRIEKSGHPDNAQRMVLIYRQNNAFPRIEGAKRYAVDEWNHLAVPRREETATALVRELARLAGRSVVAKPEPTP